MEMLSYTTFLSRCAQIERLRRQRIADAAWAAAIGARDKPDRAIKGLLNDVI